MNQVAALPYRFDEAGGLEVMLITSRGGRRWIPPKGNLIKGLAPMKLQPKRPMRKPA